MLRFLGLIAALLGVTFSFSACLDETGEDPVENQPDFLIFFNFSQGLQDWEGGAAGYSEAYTDSVDFYFAYDRSPPRFTTADSLLKLSARNPQENLFLFTKTQIIGLDTNRTYQVDFELEMLGENLGFGNDTVGSSFLGYLKVGAVTEEPTVSLQDSIYTLNLDKGDIPQSGEDMYMVGAIPTPTPSNITDLLRGNSVGSELVVNSDQEGKLWLVVGIDSDANIDQAYYLYRLGAFFTLVD